MANISHTIKTTTITLKMPPILSKRATITSFIEMLCEMNLRGRKVRRRRRILINGKSTEDKIRSIIDVKTIKKSIMFQDSLR
jgi:hypothetical protein